MNIEILRGVALSLCAATVAGLLSFLGLRRLGGIESGPVKRPSRRRRGETRLDTLTYSVSAGSSFEGALASVGTRMDGAIAEAFARVAKEAAYSSRSEALLGLADRAQVNSITFFTASLVQAERAGSSLVDIIRMQAQSVRTERRLRVDDMTNKLSTKMLFPMLLLMLPSIIMLMLAPMILQLGQFF